jgi:DNA-binding LacI/PurR family transcriptional regulator
MRSGQVTIKDIARELGISPSTVSKALKDHPDINSETKRLVKELAAKLKYKPNLIALSLLESQTKTIGLIIPQVVHHFFSSVISGIEDVLDEKGYFLMVCQSNESYEKEVKNAYALLSSRVDGILVSASKETKDLSHFTNIIESNVPVVFFDRLPENLDADCVLIDDLESSFMATEHLIKQGCKRIAHFGTYQHLRIGQERKTGYLNALKKYNLPVDEKLVFLCDTREDAKIMAGKLMSSAGRPDGIFAVNDLTALGTIEGIKSAGFKVPDDVAVMGFSNEYFSTICEPSLSSVEQHGFEMGQTAARLVLERLHSDTDFPPRKEIISTRLIIRESTAKK